MSDPSLVQVVLALSALAVLMIVTFWLASLTFLGVVGFAFTQIGRLFGQTDEKVWDESMLDLLEPLGIFVYLPGVLACAAVLDFLGVFS